MHENPYAGIIAMMRGREDEKGAYPCNLIIGSVKSTDPLIVNAAGLEFSEDEITVVGSDSLTVSVEDETLIFERTAFSFGRTVLLLTPDFQTFYLLGGAD